MKNYRNLTYHFGAHVRDRETRWVAVTCEGLIFVEPAVGINDVVT